MNWTKPEIKVEPPGPMAQKFLKRDSQVMSMSLTRSSELVAKSAHGMFVQDLDDNVFHEAIILKSSVEHSESEPRGGHLMILGKLSVSYLCHIIMLK